MAETIQSQCIEHFRNISRDLLLIFTTKPTFAARQKHILHFTL